MPASTNRRARPRGPALRGDRFAALPIHDQRHPEAGDAAVTIGIHPAMRRLVARCSNRGAMRVACVAVVLMLGTGVSTRTDAAEPPMTFVDYQGQRFELSKPYASFRDYKDDPGNLTPAQARRAEALVRAAKFGPRFRSSDELVQALVALEFPGYGLFYANQLGAHMDARLELAYVEVPARSLSRYVVLEKQSDGSLRVIDDFVTASDPEITRVRRGRHGALEFHLQNGKRVVPAHR